MQCLIKYYVLPNKSQHIKIVMCNTTVYAYVQISSYTFLKMYGMEQRRHQHVVTNLNGLMIFLKCNLYVIG